MGEPILRVFGGANRDDAGAREHFLFVVLIVERGGELIEAVDKYGIYIDGVRDDAAISDAEFRLHGDAAFATEAGGEKAGGFSGGECCWIVGNNRGSGSS